MITSTMVYRWFIHIKIEIQTDLNPTTIIFHGGGGVVWERGVGGVTSPKNSWTIEQVEMDEWCFFHVWDLNKSKQWHCSVKSQQHYVYFHSKQNQQFFKITYFIMWESCGHPVQNPPKSDKSCLPFSVLVRVIRLMAPHPLPHLIFLDYDTKHWKSSYSAILNFRILQFL